MIFVSESAGLVHCSQLMDYSKCLCFLWLVGAEYLVHFHLVHQNVFLALFQFAYMATAGISSVVCRIIFVSYLLACLLWFVADGSRSPCLLSA